MRALIVLAHPEPQSYNAHLADVAASTLRKQGMAVETSDLYAQGFDPVEGPNHFCAPKQPERFDAQTEQRHAYENGSLPADVRAEVDKLLRADVVVLQFPFWWFSVPAILKGWMDRVFVYGGLYKSSQRYDQGPCRGKLALVSTTLGAPANNCTHNGQEGDTSLLIWPTLMSLNYVGFTVLPPFILQGVRSGLSGMDAEVQQARLMAAEQDYVQRLRTLQTTPPVPFNPVTDFDGQGQLKPSAPAYHPFTRHRQKLELE